MNLGRAIVSGIILWVLIFFEVSILMFAFNLKQATFSYHITHFILLILFITLVNLFYFKKIKANFGKGLYVGVVMVIVGIILDSIITIPLWIIPQGGSYSSFLLDPALLVGELIVIVVSGVVGIVKR